MTLSLLSRLIHWWARCAGVSLILITLIHSAKAQEVSFAPVVNYPAGDSPFDLHVCDLNGDEFPDVVVLNDFVLTGTQLGVLLNDKSGGFPSFQLVPDVIAVSVTCADIDNDGDNDVIVAAGGSFENLLALNDGSGSLTLINGPMTTTSAVTRNGVVACDFDSDGDLDLAYATGFDSNPKQLELFRNRGDGTFEGTRVVPVTHDGNDLNGVKCADLDGDGHDDILGYSDGKGGSVRALFSDGLGGFSKPIRLPLYRVLDIALGNLDGLPGLDAAVVQRGDFDRGSVRLYRNSQDDVLTSWIHYDRDFILFPRAVCIGRINADSLDDVVVMSDLGAFAHVLVQVPDGFEHIDSFPVGGLRDSISCIDLNNDGFDDLVLPGGSADVIHVLINTTGLTAP